MKGPIKLVFWFTMGSASLPSMALDFQMGDGVQGKFSGTLSLGTQVRASSPDPDVYANTPSAFVPGAAPGKLVGQTGGSDLNFNKGDTISTVAKAAFDLDLRKGSYGLFLRANLWTDLAQGQNAVPYGNYPNKYLANSPLSDTGFADSARFNNIEMREYYGRGTFDLGEGQSVEARLGRQVLNWGAAQLVGGGINAAINPPDFASQFRPGALPTDSKLPLGMLSAKLVSGSNWNLEGFLPYEFRSAVLPGCGTYFDTTSAFSQGCNMAAILTPPAVPLANASEAKELVSGLYLHRSSDINASDAGQFGVALGFKSHALDADLRAYVLNTHASTQNVRMKVENIGGAYAASIPQRLTDANGLRYANVYAENNLLLGLSGNKKLGATANVYGEVAYRPNTPIGMNLADVASAFATRSPSSFLALKRGILNIAPGGTFDAYDRFDVVTVNLGSNKVFPKALGAERAMLVGEVGLSHVNGLPDPNSMRYGRHLAYGSAANAVGAACTDSVPGKTCTNDGYVTPDAWGLRLLASITYAGAPGGAQVTPSLLIAQDMDGYSYDNSFNKGRSTVRTGVRMDWTNSHYLDLQYTQFSGGNYNMAADRSYLSLTAGTRF